MFLLDFGQNVTSVIKRNFFKYQINQALTNGKFRFITFYYAGGARQRERNVT